MQPVTAVVIGAGARGMEVYAPYSHANPEALRIVGVAEPNPEKRALFARQYEIPPDNCFENDESLLLRPRIADAALICTPDQLHTRPAVGALRIGYDVLLEKPMATTEAECRAIVEAAKETGRVLMVCHVLRYTRFFSKVKKLLEQGTIGQLATIQHAENIANWHFAHSFVRGNWAISAESSPMILQKCCHDLDIIQWLAGAQCLSVSSSGSLLHFRPEMAPPGAPARCQMGCPRANSCPYYAPRLYLTSNIRWPTSVISADTSLAARENALRTGPYGRCVYHCGNDVCDHQTVNIWFANGVAATLTASAFTASMNRILTLTGTEGELYGDFEKGTIRYTRFEGGEVQEITLPAHADGLGHGGGDEEMMREFVMAVRRGGDVATGAQDALESHLMAFAAETARLAGQTMVP